MAPAHRGALECLGILGDKLIPRITVAVLGIAHHQRTLAMISHKVKLTRLVANALCVLALIAMILKKLKNTTMNFAVLIA
jgi:hypothetical protein